MLPLFAGASSATVADRSETRRARNRPVSQERVVLSRSPSARDRPNAAIRCPAAKWQHCTPGLLCRRLDRTHREIPSIRRAPRRWAGFAQCGPIEDVQGPFKALVRCSTGCGQFLPFGRTRRRTYRGRLCPGSAYSNPFIFVREPPYGQRNFRVNVKLYEESICAAVNEEMKHLADRLLSLPGHVASAKSFSSRRSEL
jgi:hypothetical protein